MKNLIILLLFIFPILLSSQIIKELPTDENGKLNYNKVVQVENTNKNELYLRGRAFFANTFKDAKEVIQMDDKDSGIIIGKAFSDIYITSWGNSIPIQMWFSIKIQAKDAKYKYEIYNIYFKSYPGEYGVYTHSAEKWFDRKIYYKNNGKPRNIREKYKIETTKEIQSLESAIISKMNTTDQNEKW